MEAYHESDRLFCFLGTIIHNFSHFFTEFIHGLEPGWPLSEERVFPKVKILGIFADIFNTEILQKI
jgi:hypothetical protein